METTPSKGTKTNVVTYTPFSKNENAAFGAYYYVTLRRIIVGGKGVRVPRKLLETDVSNDGGFIVNSGSVFTFMERPIYDMVARELRRLRPAPSWARVLLFLFQVAAERCRFPKWQWWVQRPNNVEERGVAGVQSEE
ncbi:hypothetical protein Fmac_024075 [Flemingia macrophylla]|uniref:Xylanase inhibitor C-terminal domain-containing protein n=1 Tax=Flemingia macrophylla TaxID=520843 RepID=A0ABD1LNB8_9FABA